jgi:hypothetical protein
MSQRIAAARDAAVRGLVGDWVGDGDSTRGV